MLAFVAAILVSSLLGSAHCVSMCGPMALWASGVGSQGLGRREQMLRLVGYHGGRLITFAMAGIVAGSVGGMVTIGGDWLGWQQTAARLTGSMMIGLGVWKTLHWWRPVPGHRDGGGAGGGFQQRISLAVSRRVAGLRPLIGRLPVRLRSVAIGMVTTWLPCGWLYLFVLVAAATAGVFPALAVMLAFWLGTLPALTALVAGTVTASPRFRPAMPPLIAATLIVAGIYTTSGRATTDLMPLGEAARRHAASEQLADGTASLAHPVGWGRSDGGNPGGNTLVSSGRWWQLLSGLRQEPLPCCEPVDGPAAGVR